MIFRLSRKDSLKLRQARGTGIKVLVGRVYITEEGSDADCFLDSGRIYRVGGDGLVVIQGEANEARPTDAEITVIREERGVPVLFRSRVVAACLATLTDSWRRGTRRY